MSRVSACRDKAREDWNKTTDQILALKLEIIVPGHEGPGAKHDTSAIAFVKKYLADWDISLANPKTPLKCARMY